MSEETLMKKIKNEVGQRKKLENNHKNINDGEKKTRSVKSSKFSINYTDYNGSLGR